MNTGWISQARAQGLISAEVDLTPARPWPVVVLTGLAAWLAVPPLVFAFYLLFGSSWTQGPMDYLVGLLLVALAVVLLRGRGRALFLEQLGMPLLLTGLMSVGHGLDRDLTNLQAEGAGLLITLALIVALPVSWLRQLLGAAAAALTAMLLLHGMHLIESSRALWALGHAVGLMALLLMAVQWRLGRASTGAAVAGLIEPVLAGWWVVVLGLLVWSAGPTFLVTAALTSEFTQSASPRAPVGAVDWAGWGMAGVSALLVLAGAAVLRRAWTPAQAWRLLSPVIVLAALATRMPVLGACLALLALMLATRRWRLALLAAATALWVLGSFYYDWHLPLQDKALVLIAAGAVMAAWARWMATPEGQPPSGSHASAAPPASAPGRGPAPGTDTEASPTSQGAAPASLSPAGAVPAAAPPRPQAVRIWLAAAGVLVLGTVNLLIHQKEQLIQEGRPVFVKLAPVDPRSLMQGDYMRLNYTLPGLGWAAPSTQPMWGRRLIVAAKLDGQGVVQSPRLLGPDEALPPGMVPLQLTLTRSGWTFVTDAWYFREGEDQRWAPARYGEFRLLPDGRALLVSLVGEDLKPL